jgi:hypothetical protein
MLVTNSARLGVQHRILTRTLCIAGDVVRRVRLQGEADSREPGSSAYPLIAVAARTLAGMFDFSYLLVLHLLRMVDWCIICVLNE